MTGTPWITGIVRCVPEREQKIVPPDSVDVTNAVASESIITLQTCTLPDYVDRITVQGELIDEKPA